jgi:acetolactate decarboxylase
MRNSRRLASGVALAIVPLLSIGSNQATAEEQTFTIECVGEMMVVHREGDARPRVNLQDVALGPGSFAIGPVAGLRGEITVIDGESYVATAADGAEHVAQDWAHEAPFLVYGRVLKWEKVSAPENLKSIADIEKWLPDAARVHGLDPEGPFPFKIETDESVIRYHIIANDAPGYQTVRPHSELQKPFTLTNGKATIIGVYSTKHAGIFTHHGSTTHIHMASGDKQHSGHVDAIELGKACRFFLPAR